MDILHQIALAFRMRLITPRQTFERRAEFGGGLGIALILFVRCGHEQVVAMLRYFLQGVAKIQFQEHIVGIDHE